MALHESEKATSQLKRQHQSRPFGTGTVDYYIDELPVTYPGTAIRTGYQE
jgi:hypothetical protein